jgi:MFS family permease
MSLDKMVWAVSFLAAVVLAFVSGFAMSGLVLAVLGLASGYFVKGDHRRGVLLAAIFLMGGAGALGGIPAVGAYLTAIFTNYGGVLSAASIMIIVMATAERLVPGMSSD